MGITGTASLALAIKSGQTRIELYRVPIDWSQMDEVRRIAEQMTGASAALEEAINSALSKIPQPKAEITVYQQLIW